LGGIIVVVLKNVYDPNKPEVKLIKEDLKKSFDWFEKTKNLESRIFKDGVD